MKKMISLILVCAMMAWLLPASAVPSSAAVPTVEEILNGYHQKSFEARMEANTNSIATYGTRSNSGKSLEQETVETLNAAGYEAYNVTAENYDALESSLQTDFTQMGLDPNGSYIVVISGEEAESNSNPNGRSNDKIEQETGGFEGSSIFSYTYEGTTYTMRYVTVTAADNSSLGRVSSVDPEEALSADSILDILELPSGILSTLSTIASSGSLVGALTSFASTGSILSH